MVDHRGYDDYEGPRLRILYGLWGDDRLVVDGRYGGNLVLW